VEATGSAHGLQAFQGRNHDSCIVGLALVDLHQEIARLYGAMQRQQRQLLRRTPCQPSGRHLIVVDQGIGSGLVIRAPLTLSQLVELLQQSPALPSERALAMPPISTGSD
jgi:predicted phosphoribosyltransferase